MRAVAFAFWIVAALTLLLPMFRRGRRVPGRDTARDELVKDPVCQTYVVRSRAVSRGDGAERRYFCSDECARRFALGAGR